MEKEMLIFKDTIQQESNVNEAEKLFKQKMKIKNSDYYCVNNENVKIHEMIENVINEVYEEENKLEEEELKERMKRDIRTGLDGEIVRGRSYLQSIMERKIAREEEKEGQNGVQCKGKVEEDLATNKNKEESKLKEGKKKEFYCEQENKYR